MTEDRLFIENNQLAMEACPLNFEPDPNVYGPETRHFQGIPSVAITGNRLWTTWFSGDYGENIENYVLLTHRDGLDKGSLVMDMVIDPPGNVRTCDSSLWVSPEGELFLFWTQMYGWYDGRAGVWCTSTKNPQADKPQWAQPRRLCDGIMVNKPIVMSNGQWAYPVAQWMYDVGMRAKRNPEVSLDMYRPHIYVSDDSGKTLNYQGSVDIPNERRSHDETVLLELEDGRLCMFIRTTRGIEQSFSSDYGKTWTEVIHSGIPAPVARFSVTRLKSGKILLVKNGGIDSDIRVDDRTGLVAYLSDDDGRTFTNSLVLDSRANVSYPNVDQDQLGNIYIIYDYSRYYEKEILLAKITEEDILATNLICQESKLQEVLDKASGALATVNISPDGGKFDGPVEVELTYPIFGPAVYYTLDGREPTLEDTKYTQKIIIDKTAEIYAQSIGGINGQTKSPMNSAKFEIN